MKIYENIEAERDRIQACINKYGWTSDHSLDWFIDSELRQEEGRHSFIEFSDGSGILAIKYKKEWRIWSDPLTTKDKTAEKIIEFSANVLSGEIERVWCDYVTDYIRPGLLKIGDFAINDTYFSLLYLVFNMQEFNLDLPGSHLKSMRNARNKFNREHKLEISDARKENKQDMLELISTWRNNAVKKQGEEHVYESWYKNAVKNEFKGFASARLLKVDGKPAGINAGYEVVNNPDRYVGIIGIHDYSHGDLGTIFWIEDLKWIKDHGYKEVDMQGWEENDPALKFEMRLGGRIERRTDTFFISKK